MLLSHNVKKSLKVCPSLQSHQQCAGNVFYLFAFKGEEVGSTNMLAGLFPTGKQNPVKPTSGDLEPLGSLDSISLLLPACWQPSL